MTTRGRIARGEHQQDFEGHVQRWLKQWEQVGGTSKMKVLKWVPTGEGLWGWYNNCLHESAALDLAHTL